MTRRPAHWLALALLALVALAGCGGGDDDGSRPQAATTTAAPAGEARADGAGGSASGRDEPPEARSGQSDDGDDGDAASRRGDDDPSGGRSSGGDDASGGDRASGGSRHAGRRGSSRSRSRGGRSDGGRAEPGRRSDIEAFLEDYVARYSRGDASICTEVFTQRHVEALTKRKGDAAVAKCRKDVSRNETPFRLYKLEDVKELGGGRWRAVTTLAVGNRAYRSVLELVESGSGFRIDAAG